MTQQNQSLGIMLMVVAMAIFALQDGISRHLASEYNVFMVVMIRYWFFAGFVLAIAKKRGGIGAVARTSQPILQVSRGVLLAAEICVMVAAFTLLGLVESLAIFASYPLIVVALSGPLLGEKVGPYRWGAIGFGFLGVLIILQPGIGVFSPYAMIPLLSATMFALYALLTRFAARMDEAMTSFFWTGVAGAIALTVVGIWFWEPMSWVDWAWMFALCVTGATGHWLLIRVYEIAEASAVQPLSYLHMVFASILGVMIFSETIRANVMAGSVLIIAAGLFTIWRERTQKV